MNLLLILIFLKEKGNIIVRKSNHDIGQPRTQEINGVVAIAEPSGGRLVREVNPVVGEVRLGIRPRQVVVVADVSGGVAEDVDGGDLRQRGRDREQGSGDDRKEEKRNGELHLESLLFSTTPRVENGELVSSAI